MTKTKTAKTKEIEIELDTVQDEVVKPASKSTKIEYWARQIRLDSRTISGKIKAQDKKRFLELCKSNGADIDERDWFKKDNWEDRVFKKAKINSKK